MADGQEAELEALEVALKALADDTGKTVEPGYLNFCAMFLSGGNNDPIKAQEASYHRRKAVAEAAKALIIAFNALRDDEADEICADYAVMDAVREMQQVAERPRPKLGRRPKLDAVQVASRALTVFEMITKRTPGVTVDPITGTASGAYLGLVAEAFRILSIKASAEHYAKEAIRENRTPPSAG